MSRTASLNAVIFGCTACILVIVALEQIFPPRIPVVQAPPPGKEETCVGDPIYVTYPYAGGMLDPWECKVQCEDKRQRYVLYTNGKATPCEKLPGCLDWGEDYGVLCKPPLMNSTADSGGTKVMSVGSVSSVSL